MITCRLVARATTSPAKNDERCRKVLDVSEADVMQWKGYLRMVETHKFPMFVHCPAGPYSKDYISGILYALQYRSREVPRMVL